jgi:hypothetical protein
MGLGEGTGGLEAVGGDGGRGWGWVRPGGTHRAAAPQQTPVKGPGVPWPALHVFPAAQHPWPQALWSIEKPPSPRAAPWRRGPGPPAPATPQGATTMVLEATGREDKMRAIVDLLEPYGGCRRGGWSGVRTQEGARARSGAGGGRMVWRRPPKSRASGHSQASPPATPPPAPAPTPRHPGDRAHGPHRAVARERRRHPVPGVDEEHLPHILRKVPWGRVFL